MLFCMYFLIVFLIPHASNCAEEPKTLFSSSQEWKNDTKTPENGTPEQNLSPEKRKSFQRNTSRLDACISKARQSIHSANLDEEPTSEDRQRGASLNNPSPSKSSGQRSNSSSGANNSRLLPSAEPDHFFSDEHDNSGSTVDMHSNKEKPTSKSKLRTIISSAKEQLMANQRRLSDSLRASSNPTMSSDLLKTFSNPTTSLEQVNSNIQNDNTTHNLSMSSLASPLISAATAGIALNALNSASNNQIQRRSMLSAGDVLGVGATANSVSWIATLVASGIAISQIKDWLHSSCRADKTVVVEEFKKLLQNHKLETKNDMNTIIDQCNTLIMQNQEQNNTVINHLIEALEETSEILESNKADHNHENQSPAAAAILKLALEKSKKDISQQKNVDIRKLPTLSKKTKCSSCWCCDSDDDYE